jgi:coenzyme F420-reducing hydrogenase delta subunit
MSLNAQPEIVSDTTVIDGMPWPSITAFICTNGTREGRSPSALRPRPEAPHFDWPFSAQEVLVPCAGRIQPEHLLKAFEDGSDLVCIIACREDNCHSLEGSLRGKHRMEYVQQLLAQIGLDERRLMWFSLPGSAREDMAAGSAAGSLKAPSASASAPIAELTTEITKQITARLKTLTPSPLRKFHPSQISYDEMDDANELED